MQPRRETIVRARRLRPPETTGRGGAGLIACGTTVSIRATVIFPDLFPVVLRDWLGSCETVVRQSRVFTRLTLTQPACRTALVRLFQGGTYGPIV